MESMRSETKICSTCQSGARSLWTLGRPPVLSRRAEGNWNWLESCDECGSLWVSVPHEPHASFKFWTLWPSTLEVWRDLNERDEARIIHEWHDALLRETWMDLPTEERAHVEAWRDRTYRRYNPIDRDHETPVPERRYIQKSSDLAKYLVAG
jgi:hypothetical protein